MKLDEGAWCYSPSKMLAVTLHVDEFADYLHVFLTRHEAQMQACKLQALWVQRLPLNPASVPRMSSSTIISPSCLGDTVVGHLTERAMLRGKSFMKGQLPHASLVWLAARLMLASPKKLPMVSYWKSPENVLFGDPSFLPHWKNDRHFSHILKSMISSQCEDQHALALRAAMHLMFVKSHATEENLQEFEKFRENPEKTSTKRSSQNQPVGVFL